MASARKATLLCNSKDEKYPGMVLYQPHLEKDAPDGLANYMHAKGQCLIIRAGAGELGDHDLTLKVGDRVYNVHSEILGKIPEAEHPCPRVHSAASDAVIRMQYGEAYQYPEDKANGNSAHVAFLTDVLHLAHHWGMKDLARHIWEAFSTYAEQHLQYSGLKVAFLKKVIRNVEALMDIQPHLDTDLLNVIREWAGETNQRLSPLLSELELRFLRNDDVVIH